MIFSELYGAYYNTVASVLKAALSAPVTPEALRRLIAENAFGESLLALEPGLTEGRWQLLLPDGTTPLENSPAMPLTILQRRWLKAISLDPRIRLFPVELPDDPEVEPLFTPADYEIYDTYADGDPYEDEEYIRRFRMILQAIRNETPLRIDVKNRKGGVTDLVLMPKYLEYSEKDDKFRLIGNGSRYGRVLNLGRIVKCKPYGKPFTENPESMKSRQTEEVVFELTDERNALERALLHFAHFEKEAEQLEDRRYRLTIRYDKDDETEMVIRVLSFGPVLRVPGPSRFENLIKERLIKQKNCGLS
jgi:hypothetical protein